MFFQEMKKILQVFESKKDEYEYYSFSDLVSSNDTVRFFILSLLHRTDVCNMLCSLRDLPMFFSTHVKLLCFKAFTTKTDRVNNMQSTT